MGPFDFLNSIVHTNKYIFTEEEQSEYQPFLINRGLSFYTDTLGYAEVMNRSFSVDKKLQYDYLFHSVPKKKRFSPWPKKAKENAEIAAIKKVYQYNDVKAREAHTHMTPEQLKRILEISSEGGVKS